MTVNEAKPKIFERRCPELQEPGSDGWMPIENFHAQAGVPEDVYREALAEMRDSHIESPIRLSCDARARRKTSCLKRSKKQVKTTLREMVFSYRIVKSSTPNCVS